MGMWQPISNIGQPLVLPRSCIRIIKAAPVITGGCTTGSPRTVKQFVQWSLCGVTLCLKNLVRWCQLSSLTLRITFYQNKMFGLMCISYSSLWWPLCRKSSSGGSLCKSSPKKEPMVTAWWLPFWQGTEWSRLSLIYGGSELVPEHRKDPPAARGIHDDIEVRYYGRRKYFINMYYIRKVKKL